MMDMDMVPGISMFFSILLKIIYLKSPPSQKKVTTGMRSFLAADPPQNINLHLPVWHPEKGGEPPKILPVNHLFPNSKPSYKVGPKHQLQVWPITPLSWGEITPVIHLFSAIYRGQKITPFITIGLGPTL